jgi:hypothetical protein
MRKTKILRIERQGTKMYEIIGLFLNGVKVKQMKRRIII